MPSLYIKDQKSNMELRHLREIFALSLRSALYRSGHTAYASPSPPLQTDPDLEIELGTLRCSSGDRGCVRFDRCWRVFWIEARHTMDVASGQLSRPRRGAGEDPCFVLPMANGFPSLRPSLENLQSHRSRYQPMIAQIGSRAVTMASFTLAKRRVDVDRYHRRVPVPGFAAHR